MRHPDVLKLDLTATAMLRPSTFGYPIDIASLIGFHPPLRCTCMYTCRPLYARLTYRLQLLGALAGFPLVCLPLLRQVRLSTLLQVGFSIPLKVCWPLW